MKLQAVNDKTVTVELTGDDLAMIRSWGQVYDLEAGFDTPDNDLYGDIKDAQKLLEHSDVTKTRRWGLPVIEFPNLASSEAERRHQQLSGYES